MTEIRTFWAPPPTPKAVPNKSGSGRLAISSEMGARYPAVKLDAITTNIRLSVVLTRCSHVSPLVGTELKSTIAARLPAKPAISKSGRIPRGTPAILSTGTVAAAAIIVAVVVVVGSGMAAILVAGHSDAKPYWGLNSAVSAAPMPEGLRARHPTLASPIGVASNLCRGHSRAENCPCIPVPWRCSGIAIPRAGS